jgi:hypothetical protein
LAGASINGFTYDSQLNVSDILVGNDSLVIVGDGVVATLALNGSFQNLLEFSPDAVFSSVFQMGGIYYITDTTNQTLLTISNTYEFLEFQGFQGPINTIQNGNNGYYVVGASGYPICRFTR